jgi:voltage-gated potassium channel
MENKIGFLNLIVLVLSLYVLGAIVIDTLYELPHETSVLLNYIDYGICAFFFVEFCIRFYHAEDKWRFMRWGWIDLLSCIPMVDYLRTGRLFRIIRLLRLIRAFRSAKFLMEHLFRNRAEGTFTSVSIVAVLLVIFSAIAILQVEAEAPNANITTAEDAIWWAYVTVTTVGYGDRYPVTTEGRVIAALLMTAGVGLFGTFAAYVGAWFVERKQPGKAPAQPEHDPEKPSS